MPRCDGSEAARGSAANSVSDELLNITQLARAIPMTPEELRAERRTRAMDAAYFKAHPSEESYIRKYHRHELPPLILLGCPNGEPTHVAVGFTGPGERVRVYVWPGHKWKLARKWAEQQAELQRLLLGMKATA